MRIGCFFFRNFAVQVETKDNSEMAGKPVIIGGHQHDRKPVYDASDEAMQYGIKPGMPVRQAYSLCPQGIFLPLVEERYTMAFESILDLLASFSPVVERAMLGCAFIHISHQPNELRLVEEINKAIKEQMRFKASTAIASSKFVAWIASQVAESVQVLMIPEGEERFFLGDLPVDLLPSSNEILRQLKLLGIYTMGQLASLPPDAINVAFGDQGKWLWELTKGVDKSRLRAWRKADMLEEELCFETPAETFDQISAGANRLLDRLTSQLKERWQCCRRLIVSLYFANNSFSQEVLYFKNPTSSKEAILRRFTRWLEETRFDNPVAEMRLGLADLCAEGGKQIDLLNNQPKSKDNLLSVIAQLQAKYGKGIAKKAVLSKSNSRLPEHSFFFIEFNS